jgi:hypothetical protein
MKKMTEQQLIDAGYDYVGKHGNNELWRKRDELIIYDPDEERIVWSAFNEERYQFGSGRTGDLHIGEREHK